MQQGRKRSGSIKKEKSKTVLKNDPFPGIPLYSSDKSPREHSPFPGIPLHVIDKNPDSVKETAKVEFGKRTSEMKSAISATNFTMHNICIFHFSGSLEEKNRVVALLEAYYGSNIKTNLHSFALKLPADKRPGKFVCPVRIAFI